MKQKRNSLCNCGSGKKYKKCCQIAEYENKKKEEEKIQEEFLKRMKMSKKSGKQNITKLMLAGMLGKNL
jgi:uncharacterized protein YecA (UPF0149 family)